MAENAQAGLILDYNYVELSRLQTSLQLLVDSNQKFRTGPEAKLLRDVTRAREKHLEDRLFQEEEDRHDQENASGVD